MFQLDIKLKTPRRQNKLIIQKRYEIRSYCRTTALQGQRRERLIHVHHRRKIQMLLASFYCAGNNDLICISKWCSDNSLLTSDPEKTKLLVAGLTQTQQSVTCDLLQYRYSQIKLSLRFQYSSKGTWGIPILSLSIITCIQ